MHKCSVKTVSRRDNMCFIICVEAVYFGSSCISPNCEFYMHKCFINTNCVYTTRTYNVTCFVGVNTMSSFPNIEILSFLRASIIPLFRSVSP